jgi:hypothetical protein
MKRAARPCRVFDSDGREVLISKLCPHCLQTKPLASFGLRLMGDGKVRCAPWCKACRGAARTRPPGTPAEGAAP